MLMKNDTLISISLRYRGFQTIWYCVLYTEWVLFLNLIYNHYNMSEQPIHHQTEVWWFNGILKCVALI